MLVIKQKFVNRCDLQDNPNILYLFGDNLERQGMGGQAGHMRGEPNAFGIATKRSITHAFPDDYFFDQDEDTLPIIGEEFDRLQDMLAEPPLDELRRGKVYKYDAIVVPTDGLGTGLSRMPEFAPKALQYIELRINQLKEF